jgi:hypothetical protein
MPISLSKSSTSASQQIAGDAARQQRGKKNQQIEPGAVGVGGGGDFIGAGSLSFKPANISGDVKFETTTTGVTGADLATLLNPRTSSGSPDSYTPPAGDNPSGISIEDTASADEKKKKLWFWLGVGALVLLVGFLAWKRR